MLSPSRIPSAQTSKRHGKGSNKAARRSCVEPGLRSKRTVVVPIDLAAPCTNGLEYAQSLVARVGGAVPIETVVLTGIPEAELVRLAAREDAQMMILCENGPIAPTHWATGSVTDKVIQSSTAPTLVMRDGGRLIPDTKRRRGLRVLVGYDFSPGAASALRWVADLGLTDEAQITVAHISSVKNDLAAYGSSLASWSRSAETIRGDLEHVDWRADDRAC